MNGSVAGLYPLAGSRLRGGEAKPLDRTNVPCRFCGQPLAQLDWNTRLFLLLCDTPGCTYIRTPQAKRYKDTDGRPGIPVASQWMVACGMRLVCRLGRYKWAGIRKVSP